MIQLSSLNKCRLTAICLSLKGIVFSQDIQWQQVIGGAHSEYLYDLKPTPDYGFLLAGSSFSDESGNKTEKGKGDLDYFLWKMDEKGKMEWQKSYGGNGSDYLYSVALTKEGGFILGGSSDSGKSEDKSEDCYGNMDFWILKLDPTGELEWQKTLGGIGNDQLQSIQQTADGGFIIGGSSDSSPILSKDGEIIGNKSQESFGSFDYWVIKLTSQGEIEWEKTFGGMFSDQLKSIQLIEDGFLIGGTSNSPVSGNKTAGHLGESDFWILKLDNQGNQIWQKTYGGEGDESFAQIIVTDNGYLLAGSSNSNTSENKKAGSINGTDFWLVEIDEKGDSLWDNTYDVGKWDMLVTLVKTKENEYLLGGYASSETLNRKADTKGVNDFVVLKVNQRGELLWNKTIGGNGTDQLKGLTQTRDGGYILAGNSDSKKSADKDRASIGGNDYWVVKLANEDKKTEEERQLVEIYPNPTIQFTNVVITTEFTDANVQVFDLNGRKLQEKKLPYRSTPVDLQGYGPGVYIFKITIDGVVSDVKVIKKGGK